MVAALFLDQLVVGATFHNFTVFNHQNLVGTADGAEPVRNHKGGAVLQQLAETLLNFSTFSGRIHLAIQEIVLKLTGISIGTRSFQRAIKYFSLSHSKIQVALSISSASTRTALGLLQSSLIRYCPL